jgi:hypothetical protein
VSRGVGATVALAGFLLAAAACSGEREPTSSDDAANETAVVAEARAQPGPGGPLLGMSFGRLFRLDPRTLKPLPGRRARLGGHTFGWSFSPDRSMLVLGSQVVAELRFVDLERMRIIGGDDLRLKRPGIVAVIAWPAPRRVLAVVQSPGCCIGEATAFVVDPPARRVLRRQALGGSLQAFARFRGGLALLLSPPRSLGPTRLVVFDGRGAVRSVVLAEIVAGQEPVRPGNRPGRESRPGLAIDAAGGRAFVVVGGASVAEVDLASLRVRYRTLSQPVSLLGRLRAWLEPAARADVPPAGPVRTARWLGGGLVAVAGRDSYYERGLYRTRPSGLKLIDVGSGRVRTLDPLADGFTVAAGMLVPATRQPGLNVYSGDGRLRFRLFLRRFPGKRAFVVFAREGRAFVTIASRWPRAFVVDLSSGRVLGERRVPRAQLVSPGQELGWP